MPQRLERDGLCPGAPLQGHHLGLACSALVLSLSGVPTAPLPRSRGTHPGGPSLSLPTTHTPLPVLQVSRLHSLGTQPHHSPCSVRPPALSQPPQPGTSLTLGLGSHFYGLPLLWALRAARASHRWFTHAPWARIGA